MTTLAEKALVMYQQHEYDKLKTFKKDRKKSWTALGIDAEMLAHILDCHTSNAEMPAHTVVENKPCGNEAEVVLVDEVVKSKAMSKRRLLRLINVNLKVLKYRSRSIHGIMGETSHNTLALLSEILEQEKFRKDPRFPLFQVMQRYKRFQAIFKRPPYGPIFP